jgi:leader peptidase (prepilin peptidase)/N-methyltransferase
MHTMTLSDPVLIAVSAIAGLIVGSAIVVAAPLLVAHRLQEPPPRAPLLALVPLAGALIARWRPIRATITELVTAGVFAGLARFYGQSDKLVLAAAYTTLLIAIAYIDLDHRLVLNRLSYPGILLAFATSWLWPDFSVLDAVLGAVTGLVIFGILQVLGRGALGMGDTKLAIFIGALFGLPAVLNALLLGMLLGGLGALFSLIIVRRGRKEYIAYAPYLSAGAILAFFFVKP